MYLHAEIYVSDMKYLLTYRAVYPPHHPGQSEDCSTEHGEAFPPRVPVPAHNYHNNVSTISILYFLDISIVI